MGHVAVTIVDAADIRAFQCRLPDDVPVARLASRLAEMTHLPVVGPDSLPVNYGFVMKGGELLDPSSALRDLYLPPEPVTLRLVPEIVVGADEDELPPVPPAPDEDPGPEVPDIDIGEQIALIHDADFDLRLDVRVDAAVHKQIEHFAGKDRNTECAGLLLGTVTTEHNHRVLHITAFAPAVGAVSSRTSVRVTLEAWESMLRVRDRDFACLRVLGWFHTHAGWGVFMSDLDVFIHRHFFPHPNMVAYVMDPTTGRDGFFYWHDGKISLCASYALVGAPATGGVRSDRAVTRARSRPDLRDAAIALLVVLTGYLAFFRPAAEGPAHRAVTKRPSTTAARPVRPPQPPAMPRDQVYTIAPDDNMWLICNRAYDNGDLGPALAEYNGISDLSSLRVGQQIKLPPKEVLEKLSRQ